MYILVNSFQYLVGRTAHEHMVMGELLRAGMQLSLFGISNPNHQILGGLNIPDVISHWHGGRIGLVFCPLLLFDCCMSLVHYFCIVTLFVWHILTGIFFLCYYVFF